MVFYIKITILYLFVSLKSAYADELIEPSFNCANANNRSEKLICSDSQLAIYDQALNVMYKRANTIIEQRNIEPIKISLASDQKSWLKQRNELSTKEDLIAAYRDRLGVLYTNADIDNNFANYLVEKFSDLLIKHNIIDITYIRKKDNTKQSDFVYDMNILNKTLLKLGACQDNVKYISKVHGKRLEVSVSTSSGYCGGAHIFHAPTRYESYCLINEQYRRTNEFFDCPDDNPSKISSLIFNHLISIDLKTNSNTEEELLSTLLYTFANTIYAQKKWLYSRNMVDKANRNFQVIIDKAMPYKHGILDIANHLIIVYDSIKSTDNWDKKLSNHKPHIKSRLMDKDYNPVSYNFPILDNISREKIYRGTHYTYNEFYHLFWYETYKQGTMEEIHSLLNRIKLELENH